MATESRGVPSAAVEKLFLTDQLLRRRLLQLFQDHFEVETRGLPTLRIFLEGHQELAHAVLGRCDQIDVIEQPIVISIRRDVGTLIRVGPQVDGTVIELTPELTGVWRCGKDPLGKPMHKVQIDSVSRIGDRPTTGR
jgi:hypothetical protein